MRRTIVDNDDITKWESAKIPGQLVREEIAVVEVPPAADRRRGIMTMLGSERGEGFRDSWVG